MKIALLLYGTLNTHGLINAPSSNYRSIPKELLKLHGLGDLALDVFVYTEDKNFFKWTPDEKMETGRIHGFPLLDWVEDRYAVCQYNALDIRKHLYEIYGSSLKDVVVLEDAYDKALWSSSGESYQACGTTNNWRNTMIMTFLDKKRRVFELAKKHDYYDCYAICRPDSELRFSKNQSDISRTLLSMLEGLAQEDQASACVDFTNLNKDTFRLGRGYGMMKNDDFFANLAGIECKVSLFDYIQNNYAGNFFSAYDTPVFRCNACYHIDALAKGISECPICGSADLANVTEWPEFKMYCHISKNIKNLSSTPFTCTVVR